MNEKIYVGTGTEKVFQDGSSLINVTLSLDGMKKHFEDYGFTTDQGKKKLGIVVSRRKEPDRYGHTHYAVLNTYKPNQEHRPATPEPTAPEPEEEEDPFLS